VCLDDHFARPSPPLRLGDAGGSLRSGRQPTVETASPLTRFDLDCTRLALSVARPANGPLFSGKGRAIGLRPPSRLTPLPGAAALCYVTFRPEGMMAYQETFVQRDQDRIYVRDHPGAEPAIILMHGFPDNVHLYDRLSPYLSPPRRIVLFDFLGWGSSDKPP